MNRIYILILLVIFSTDTTLFPAHANDTILTEIQKTSSSVKNQLITASQDTSKFKPDPKVNKKIDYDAWSTLLQGMVLYTGPSTRIAYHREPGPSVAPLHQSKFHEEGNKIPFSAFDKRFTKLITLYREELEEISRHTNISQLQKNEQLAYWMNLHNVSVIEQIALNYRVRSPRRIKIDINGQKTRLHDAKILNVSGERLSLRDIRENIVYKYWSDPIVQYGFFMGDIGSPTIQNYAYTGDNLYKELEHTAYEFTNSMRGFRHGYISEIYFDNANFFFPNFQNDIREHLKKHMRSEVRAELNGYSKLKRSKYTPIVADLTAGFGNRALRGTTETNRKAYLSSHQEKLRILKKKGLITSRGTVVIEDIETEDVDTQSESSITID